MPDIIQVIKYEGDNQTFIWKHPREDFTLGSQLIVHESQEAIFFKDGKALDIFGPGRYTLTTKNIPLVGGVVKFVTGGVTPFHCEIYFVNKTEQLGIKWGTDSQVNYLDPNYNNYPFPVGASGEMNLRVTDARKLLVKVAGTASQLTQNELAQSLRGPMMAKIKSYLPAVLSERKIPIFDIDQHMEEFSEELRERLAGECEDYGVEMVKFWINSFVKPENDPTYCRLRDLRGRGMTDVEEAKLQQQTDLIRQQTKSKKTVMEAEARAQGRQIEGFTYRAFDVAAQLAQNEGVGSMSAMGAGLGMIGGMAGGVGGVVAGLTGDALRPIAEPFTDGSGQTAQQGDGDSGMSGATVDTAPASSVPQTRDIKARMADLNVLREMGAVSDEEYEAKRKEILDSI